jgi:hypothetical protein
VTQVNPFDLADSGWAEWYTDAGASYTEMLTTRSNRGEVFDLDAGIVLRPTVLGEGREDDRAIVFDCMLDGSVWRLPNGDLGEGSTAGVINNGLGAAVQRGQTWQVARIADQPEACL